MPALSPSSRPCSHNMQALTVARHTLASSPASCLPHMAPTSLSSHPCPTPCPRMDPLVLVPPTQMLPPSPSSPPFHSARPAWKQELARAHMGAAPALMHVTDGYASSHPHGHPPPRVRLTRCPPTRPRPVISAAGATSTRTKTMISIFICCFDCFTDFLPLVHPLYSCPPQPYPPAHLICTC